MRIVGPDRAAIRLAPQYAGGSTRTTEDAEPEADVGSALVTIEPPAPADRAQFSTQRPAAAFVAQLIATQMQAPQTRERRRIEPGEGIAIYRSMTKPVAQRRPAFGKGAIGIRELIAL